MLWYRITCYSLRSLLPQKKKEKRKKKKNRSLNRNWFGQCRLVVHMNALFMWGFVHCSESSTCECRTPWQDLILWLFFCCFRFYVVVGSSSSSSLAAGRLLSLWFRVIQIMCNRDWVRAKWNWCVSYGFISFLKYTQVVGEFMRASFFFLFSSVWNYFILSRL